MMDLTVTYDLVLRVIISGEAAVGLAILLATKYFQKRKR